MFGFATPTTSTLIDFYLLDPMDYFMVATLSKGLKFPLPIGFLVGVECLQLVYLIDWHFGGIGIWTEESPLNAYLNNMERNDIHLMIIAYPQPQQPSKVENNTLVGGGDGIVLLDDNSTIMIANNSIKDMNNGITLLESSARVYNNNIQNMSNIAILLDHNSTEDIFNNTISYALGGITMYPLMGWEVSSPHIRNNTITKISYSGIYLKGGGGSVAPKIEFNNISDNKAYLYMGFGIRIEMSNVHPIIINNTISDNVHGVYLMDGANATIHGNNIYDNTLFGVNNLDETIEVNATENWWGDSTGPHHPVTNEDGDGDEVSNYVKYKPWLTLPAF